MAQHKVEQQDEMQLGRYHLLKRVGRGGMGEVWLANDPQLHRQVAIKMLPPQKQYNQDYAALFEREAQVVASLNHPHILPVHDYGEQQLADGQVINYLVMPYISGGSLGDLIERRAAAGEGFHYREALALLMQAAEAIDYAGTQGMIHRDIKPANMLLRSEGSLLLADFGIALMVARDNEAEKSGEMVGTPLYMAPEQAQGKATAASDFYSLAILAYQLVTGRPPFQAETGYATIIQHIVQAPPSPLQWLPELPTACAEVLLRGLAKKPEERYASAREFVAALICSLNAEDMLPGTPPPAPTTNNAKKSVTRRNLLIGTAISVVALGGTGSIWALSRRTPTPSSVHITPKLPQPAMILRDLQTPPDSLSWMPGTNILTTTCSAENAVKFWNIDAFRLQNLGEYESTYTKNAILGAAQSAWSQDGKYLAVSDTRADFDLDNSYIDIFTSDLSATAPGFEKGIKIPSINIKGIGWLVSRYLVVIWDNVHDDFIYIGMWDITQPQLRPQPTAIKASVAFLSYDLIYLVLAISPDATTISLASSKGLLLGKTEIKGNKVVWEQSQQIQAKGIFGSLNGAIWSGDGQRLLGITDGFGPLNVVFGWDPVNQPRTLLRFGIPQDAAEFTYIAAYPKADKRLFAAGTKDGRIYVWNGQTRTLPVRVLFSPAIQGKVEMLAWSPDGQWLAASYNDIDVTILIWKIEEA